MAVDPDAAGQAALGSTATGDSPLVPLAVDTPRTVLISTINRLIDSIRQAIARPTYGLGTDGGWTVQDFGTFRRYHRTYPVAAVAIASRARTTIATVPQPTGKAASNYRIFVSWEGDYSGHAAYGVEKNSSSGWVLNLGNTYNDTLTFSGELHIMLEEITS